MMVQLHHLQEKKQENLSVMARKGLDGAWGNFDVLVH